MDLELLHGQEDYSEITFSLILFFIYELDLEFYLMNVAMGYL